MQEEASALTEHDLRGGRGRSGANPMLTFLNLMRVTPMRTSHFQQDEDGQSFCGGYSVSHLARWEKARRGRGSFSEGKERQGMLRIVKPTVLSRCGIYSP